MNNNRYTKEHEWINLEGELGTVGITNYAQEQLGDVVFIELPRVDVSNTLLVAAGDEVAVVESVKAASEIYAPVSGKVIEVNGILSDTPEAINEDPEGVGWLWKMIVPATDELKQLMDEDNYLRFLEESA